jgi:hypothetical protein
MIPACVALGRFREAQRLAAEHDRLLEPLTPHHRVHGIAVILELEELLGGWGTIRSLRARTEADVRANEATPCARNARSLLVQALAHVHGGDMPEARRLEAEAEHAGHSPSPYVGSVRARLALARGDDDVVPPAAIDTRSRGNFVWFGFSTVTAKLDAGLALGPRDAVEEVATPYLDGRNRYLEPFALRALGRVRGDRELIRRSLASFEALRLDWHADETRALL